MKKQIGLMVLVILSVTLQGCAHSAHNRGSVVMKHSDTDVDICLGRGEVSEGDRVTVFRHECTQNPVSSPHEGEGRAVKSCKKIQIGSGLVTRVVDEHYSTVKLDPGLSVKEGFTVEKD